MRKRQIGCCVGLAGISLLSGCEPKLGDKTNILFIFSDDHALKAIAGKRFAFRSQIPLFVGGGDNVKNFIIFNVAVKNHFNDGYFLLIQQYMTIGILFIAKRQATQCFAGQCAVSHAAPYLLRQFHAVIFRHTFQHAFQYNAGGVIGNVLAG